MFRRGAQLPARPSIPSKDEILSDLKDSCSDDVIYKIKEYLLDGCEVPEKDFEFEECVKPATSDLKIHSFLNKMSHLKDYLTNITDQKANLNQLEKNLLKDMLRIKEEMISEPS